MQKKKNTKSSPPGSYAGGIRKALVGKGLLLRSDVQLGLAASEWEGLWGPHAPSLLPLSHTAIDVGVFEGGALVREGRGTEGYIPIKELKQTGSNRRVVVFQPTTSAPCYYPGLSLFYLGLVIVYASDRRSCS
jgi:hypothetical protein